MQVADIRVAGGAFFICLVAACAAALTPEDTSTETVAAASPVVEQTAPPRARVQAHGSLIGGTGVSYENW